MLCDDLQLSPFQSYLVFKVDDSHKIVDWLYMCWDSWDTQTQSMTNKTLSKQWTYNLYSNVPPILEKFSSIELSREKHP